MDSLYYRKKRRRQRELFLPFLIIVFVILVIAFLTQLVLSFRNQSEVALKNTAHVSLSKGKAEFLAWGQDKWREVYPDLVLVEGDKILSGIGANVVLDFFDGSRVRLDSDTEVEILSIDSGSDVLDVVIKLHQGQIWVNENISNNLFEDVSFNIRSKYLNLFSGGSIFSVSSGTEDFIRVLYGEVKVQVLNESLEDAEILEALSLGVGQQVKVDKVSIDDLEARKYVNLLSAIDDFWTVTDWYLWNISQDESPPLTVEEKTSSDVEAVLDAPTLQVTSPVDKISTINTDQVYLKGTVSENVSKILVTEFHKDKNGSAYPLQKYVAGSGIWNYAVSKEFGNLVDGRNRFIFQAFSEDGLMSEPVEIVLNYEVEKPEVAPVKEQELESPSVSTGVSAKLISIDPATKVSEFSYKTTAERVVITGTAGSTVSKVLVNDWPLSLYEPGSETWVYYAKTEIGTLKSGLNSYSVTLKDVNDKTFGSFRFTIEKTE